MLLAPCFDAKDIEKERRVIAEELRATEDAPSELIHLILDDAMWGDQPLGRDIAGDEESVVGLTREQVLAHWRTHYNPANMVISIAGNIQPDRAVAAIEQALGALPAGAPPSFCPARRRAPAQP